MSTLPVTIAGAGPGDPELLTMKAYKRLKAADLVLHDALVPPLLLNLVSSEAELVNVGKRCEDGQDQEIRQEHINSLMIKTARSGCRCVRLKAGDPFVFGRGVEEVRALLEQGIDVEVIPGITAGIAAADLLHIPLTERNRMHSVVFCTGHTARYSKSQFGAVAAQLLEGSSMVMYMGLSGLEPVAARLIELGISPGMPVCAISQVSQPRQQLLYGTLADIGSITRQSGMATPVVFIMGEHCIPVERTLSSGIAAHPGLKVYDSDIATKPV
ncbi:MAG: uroporphyrinogen-III C-methyltransferase [Chlorobiaceae bacterium]|jgi:uroporphyrin-III C-methyltransferase|nr:uroporphyrinogen-III C-methyltransferase [Chlorobiaceae bacterium]